MDAIGLNPIKLDAIGLDPIRMNAIRLGVPGASSGSARPYIDPDLLKHVKMAISTWGKSNDDPDRAILKDLSGNGNDMRLLNFGFAGNSGYGLYTQYFSSWSIHGNQTGIIKDSTSVKVVGKLTNKYIVYHIQAVASSVFKIKITGLKYSIEYTYNNSGIKKLIISSDGIYDIPASSAVEGSFSTAGFYFDEKYLDSDWTGFTIEIIPDFEGWLCTDGVDDIIESVKPVSEMLEGSNEITVVSIIHGIGSKNAYTNVLRESGPNYIRNTSTADGKTGIYGYTCKDTTKSIITDILGDKNDYKLEYIQTTTPSTVNSVFSVAGWRENNGSMIVYPVAYAGGFIANKVLTTDEINQIIAYFNLDRPGQIIKPQLYCNIKKQGITNDNHAEFNDQLIDFVGGHNIQLNNVAWKGESGIGKYNVDFDSWIPQFNIADSVHTSNKLCVTRIKNPQAILYTRAKVNSMKVEVKGSQSLELFYQYVDKDDNMILLSLQGDGIYDLPASIASANNYYTGFRVSNYTGECDITITQIPENPDALHLDGISDFGKATGLPILKDYTICALRKWLYDDSVTSTETGSIVSKSKFSNNGAFILEQTLGLNSVRCGTWNFGTYNALEGCDKLIEESLLIKLNIVIMATLSNQVQALIVTPYG